MKTIQITLLCLLFSIFSLPAQDYLTISGKILDKKTKAPIGFANIGLPQQGIGTTSSDDGTFTFKLPIEFAEQKVRISYLGYAVFTKKAASFSPNEKIYLQQQATELSEVVVTGKSDAKDIIRTAITKVKENYPTYPTNVLAFYRESLTDDLGNYEYLAEGVLRVHKNAYTSRNEGDVSLIQARKLNLKNPLDTTLNAQFSSGHMAAHRFDIVKNREDFFNKKFLRAYSYTMESATLIDGRPTWVISFDRDKDFVKKAVSNSWLSEIFGRGADPVDHRMVGTVYIDQETYALVRTEFEITKDGLNKTSDYPLYSGNWKGNYYLVNYRNIGGKWHFSDALREGTYRNGEIYANEVLITENDGTEGKEIPYVDRMSKNGYFADNTMTYNEDFWKNYNTTPLNSKLRESVQQMNNSLKSEEVFDPAKMRALQELRDSTQLAERLAELEEEQGDLSEMSEEELRDLLPEQIIINENDDNNVGVRFNWGAGVHIFDPKINRLNINYLSEDLSSEILSLNGEMSDRNYEIIMYYDFDASLGKHFFLRFGGGGDFYNNIYKEGNFGLGYKVNLSKGRPVNLVFLAQHSRLRYARKLGQADNLSLETRFEADGKRFTAEKVNLYYGSRTHNAKLSAEFSIEMKRHQSLYVRGSYYLPFATRQDVWLWERGQIFRRKVHIPADDNRLQITQNGEPFTGATRSTGSFNLSVGITFH